MLLHHVSGPGPALSWHDAPSPAGGSLPVHHRIQKMLIVVSVDWTGGEQESDHGLFCFILGMLVFHRVFQQCQSLYTENRWKGPHSLALHQTLPTPSTEVCHRTQTHTHTHTLTPTPHTQHTHTPTHTGISLADGRAVHAQTMKEARAVQWIW